MDHDYRGREMATGAATRGSDGTSSVLATSGHGSRAALQVTFDDELRELLRRLGKQRNSNRARRSSQITQQTHSADYRVTTHYAAAVQEAMISSERREISRSPAIRCARSAANANACAALGLLFEETHANARRVLRLQGAFLTAARVELLFSRGAVATRA